MPNIKKSKDSTHTKKKLLELINKVKGYKIDIQKSVAFLYTNNKLTERKIKKIIPFIIASKIIKFSGIHFTKEVEALYIDERNRRRY